MSASDRLVQLEQENLVLRDRIQALEKQLAVRFPNTPQGDVLASPFSHTDTNATESSTLERVARLTNPEIARYSRHLLLPEVGIPGQLQLRNAAVLVVGAGGLGAPCLLYLAAMGVGKLGIVDHDHVEVSNLQRQVIHTETRAQQGMSKGRSAQQAIRALNSNCRSEVYDTLLDSSNAMEIMTPYDVVVDATDNVPTRYLINDACVLLGKPLVSASALKLEGQLTVYHHQGGPCYRCLFPVPPPPETVTNCSEGGVLGVVPGVLGTLQALEVVKVLLGKTSPTPSLLLFSAFSFPLFRSIKIRSRQSTCAICGDQPTITQLQDYVAFCQSQPVDQPLALQILGTLNRVTCENYAQVRQSGDPHILLDVREPVEFAICHLPNAINIPWKVLPSQVERVQQYRQGSNEDLPIYVICRLGNDSQLATQHLLSLGLTGVKDVIGGLRCWTTAVDPDFPVY
ncbi:hypothetical protein IWQ62_001925 [Dispira parvispora]|uniref:Needs CLA4 to survive protein 3 n=1 Tax=Dispira parvispora TaxID=1520584 RepID=A0A9W8AWV2_9FUNG|nr:hypothetical protein IWQ62_001925 [Dispira parvispora]